MFPSDGNVKFGIKVRRRTVFITTVCAIFLTMQPGFTSKFASIVCFEHKLFRSPHSRLLILIVFVTIFALAPIFARLDMWATLCLQGKGSLGPLQATSFRQLQVQASFFSGKAISCWYKGNTFFLLS